ncbi:PilZ domain-containing protein [Lysobacter cavernae]|uniref:PilZ domain-containing protein n=1 Tax=Lysobacter cavernae TaxID=1685901 RepID=A0ABV7RSJ7_9GAMM
MIEEFRRTRRRRIVDTVQVVDTMTDAVIGHLSNLSETGMLLIASAPLADDALYQLRFSLLDAPHRVSPIEVGAHLLWQDKTSVPGQTWTGFRFITMLESELLQLRQWLDSPGGSYA